MQTPEKLCKTKNKIEQKLDVFGSSTEIPTSEYCVGLLSASNPLTTRQVACRPHVLAGCTTSPPTASSRCTSPQNQFRTTFWGEPDSTGIRHGTTSIGWLNDWLVGWLIGWMIGWSDWLNEWSVERLMVSWLIDSLVDWLSGWLIGWLVEWIGWLVGWTIDGWLVDRLVDRLVIGWLIDLLVDC